MAEDSLFLILEINFLFFLILKIKFELFSIILLITSLEKYPLSATMISFVLT